MIGQSANGPALVATVLTVLSWILLALAPMSALALWTGRAAALAWIYWSGLELFTGVNPFRRLLGAIVLLVAITGLFRLK